MTTHPGLILLRAGALVAIGFSMALAIEYYGPGATFCAAGGGCAQVHGSSIGQLIGDYLPALGLFAYTAVFVASLFANARAHLFAVYASIVGAIGAIAFLVIQGMVVGAWCKLCVGVDSAAIAAAAGAGWLLQAKPPAEQLGQGLRSPAWFFYWPIAFAPVVWIATFPDAGVPDAVRELWDDDAEVNIVEMADFECPYCRAMHPVLEDAIEPSGANVHLARIVYPLSFHPHARNSSRAYFCAVEQERGDDMADALFTAEDISVEGNRVSAEEIGLDLDAYDECIDAERTEERVSEDLARGDRAVMEGLPTVYIGEQTFRGFLPNSPPDRFIAAIQSAASGEGRRIRWWPITLVLILAFGSLYIARQAQRPMPPEPNPESDATPEPEPPPRKKKARRKKARRKKKRPGPE